MYKEGKTKKIEYLPFAAAALLFLIALFFFLEAMLSKSLNYTFGFIGYGGTFKYSHVKTGGFSLSLYWAAQYTGIIAMIIICLCRRAFCGIGKVKAVLTGILLFVFGFIGAKLLYIAENLKSVLENGLTLGGVSFFGTVFLLPVFMPLIGLAFKVKPGRYLDFCTPAVLLMLSFIRLGCFMNGCCEGISFWFKGRPVTIPVQLLEAALDFALLGIILSLNRAGKYTGRLYFVFMTGYGIFRFILEFIRNTPKTHLGLSNGQWFSLISIAVGIIFLLIRKKENIHEEN